MPTQTMAAMLRRHFPNIDPAAVEDAPTGQAVLTPEEQEEFLRRRAVRRHDARVPALFAAARATDEQVIAWTDALLAGRLAERPSLMLFGQVGRGKTYQAYGALRRLAESGRPGFAWAGGTASEIYARLRPNSGEEYAAVFAELANAPVLLLDDLAAGKDTDWTEDTTLALLDARSRRLMPVVVTSNATPIELRAMFGDRVTSRLGGMCTTVELTGPDRRLA